jgi:ergothioneine biosynthesis protein EgtB
MTSIFKRGSSEPTATSELTAERLPILRQQIQQAMQQCRDLTLALLEPVDYPTFCRQAHPDFSPIGWHLGHIAYTESLWLLEHSAGLPPQFPQYRRLFAANGVPKAERVALPAIAEVYNYLNVVRSQVFEYLDVAPLDEQERLWRWLLQHESQHCETITLVLELIKQETSKIQNSKFKIQNSKFKIQNSNLPSVQLSANNTSPVSDMVCIPAGEFECGNDTIAALDNERPLQRLELPTYWIDRYPVTCAQYQTFITTDGYQDARWWSSAGWQWQQIAQVTQPQYWSDDPAFKDHPVCGISWYEAEAYARFVGKRLPTEAEWEKAASWNPVTAQRQLYPWGNEPLTADRCNHNHLVGGTSAINDYPAGQSFYGCYEMLGNVWEWTASWFTDYPGFETYPYRGYSQVYFDEQHRVLKGGSWATPLWTIRAAFRNWYHPHVREVLVGFRCAI